MTEETGAQGTLRIATEALEALLNRIFLHAGASGVVAEILAANCSACERDGAGSHGVFRMPGYVDSIRSGWVDATAQPRIEHESEGLIRVDAANGFAQPALALAAPIVAEKAARNGAAVLSIRNSHHFSALWPDVEPFARQGLLALSVVNSFACTVPFHAKSAIFGTNPIAFAAPRAGEEPVVVDMATSAMANGDVQIAAREGRPLPPGHGVDNEGNPTTDPRVVLDGGALLPFGGYKGASISLMIELFCAALTGGKFSCEVDWSTHPGAQTPHTGQLVIVIDPDHGREPNFFARRASELTQRLVEVGAERLPGERRYRNREEALSKGIPMRTEVLQKLYMLAGEVLTDEAKAAIQKQQLISAA